MFESQDRPSQPGDPIARPESAMHQTTAPKTFAALLSEQQTSLLEEACRKVVDGQVEDALLLLDQAQALVWEPRVEILRKQLAAVRHPLPARAIERIRRADESRRAGDPILARLCLEAAIERDPANPAVLRAAATVYEDMDLPEEGLRCRDLAILIESGARARKAIEELAPVAPETVVPLVFEPARGPVELGSGDPVFLTGIGGTSAREDWAGQHGFWIRHDLVRVRRPG